MDPLLCSFLIPACSLLPRSASAHYPSRSVRPPPALENIFCAASSITWEISPSPGNIRVCDQFCVIILHESYDGIFQLMILDVLVAGGVIGIALGSFRSPRSASWASSVVIHFQECVCFIRMLAVLADHGYQRIVGRIWLQVSPLIGHIKLWNDSISSIRTHLFPWTFHEP